MAAGDIALTAPRSIPTLQFLEFIITLAPSPAMTFTWAEAGAGGLMHVSRVTDASCSGWDYSAGVFTDGVPRAIANEFTKLVGILFGAGAQNANQRRTAAIQALVTDGVNTIAGTVG